MRPYSSSSLPSSYNRSSSVRLAYCCLILPLIVFQLPFSLRLVLLVSFVSIYTWFDSLCWIQMACQLFGPVAAPLPLVGVERGRFVGDIQTGFAVFLAGLSGDKPHGLMAGVAVTAETAGVLVTVVIVGAVFFGLVGLVRALRFD